MNSEKNPEALHQKASKTSQIDPGFVSLRSPSRPLTGMSDKPDPEVSKSGSQKLRENLLK